MHSFNQLDTPLTYWLSLFLQMSRAGDIAIFSKLLFKNGQNASFKFITIFGFSMKKRSIHMSTNKPSIGPAILTIPFVFVEMISKIFSTYKKYHQHSNCWSTAHELLVKL